MRHQPTNVFRCFLCASLSCTFIVVNSHHALAQSTNAQEKAPDRAVADRVIRNNAGASEIVITTTARLAGAIHSLTWNGKEFINSLDHGRQLQSAVNLDIDGAIHPETFNPTEAGAERDMDGPTSTSRLLWSSASKNQLFTINRMAFWLQPGQSSGGFPARNQTLLSNHLLMKDVQIGEPGLEHTIRYSVTFVLPKDEEHHQAVFEALTGYMPGEFHSFYRLNPDGTLTSIDDGPGEQSFPIVASTSDQHYAMGVISPSMSYYSNKPASYGRWHFKNERVSKWNCVFRESSEDKPLRTGSYHYDMFVAVGSLEIVRTTMHELAKRRSGTR